MHLPTLPSISNSHVYVEGDVSINPSAAIASGVILRADPGSKMIIAAGVCIGMGSILHAYQGTLEVGAGANLGAGVLVVGKVKIGANACVGATTTIWNASIESQQVVPAGSLIGEKGRQITDVSSSSTNTSISPTPEPRLASTSTSYQESLNGQVPTTKAEESSEITEVDSQVEATDQESNAEADSAVYGQGNLNRLLKTLFPYNQSLILPPEDG